MVFSKRAVVPGEPGFEGVSVEVDGGEELLNEGDGLEELYVEANGVAVDPQWGDVEIGHAVGAFVLVEQEEVRAEAVVGEEPRAPLRVEDGLVLERDDGGLLVVHLLGRERLGDLYFWSAFGLLE